MLNRIQKIIHYKKLTASAFADKIGVPRSTISHIVSGRNNPSLEFVQKVLDNFPEIRTEWLVRGEGPMLKTSNTLFPDEEFGEIIAGAEKKSMKTHENVEKDKNSSKSETKTSSSDGDNFHDPQETRKEITDSEEGKKPLKVLENDDAMVNTEIKDQNSSGKKFKKAVRVLIFYGDGSYTEHFPA